MNRKLVILAAILMAFYSVPLDVHAAIIFRTTYPSRTLTYQDTGKYYAEMESDSGSYSEYAYLILSNVSANSITVYMYTKLPSTHDDGSITTRVVCNGETYELEGETEYETGMYSSYMAYRMPGEFFTFSSLQPNTVYPVVFNGSLTLNVRTKSLAEEAATNATYALLNTVNTNVSGIVTSANTAATNATAAKTAAETASTGVSGVKTDTTAIKTDTTTIKSMISGLDTDVASVDNQLQIIGDTLTTLNTAIGNVNSSIEDSMIDNEPPRVLKFQASNGVDISDTQTKNFDIAASDRGGAVYYQFCVTDLVTGLKRYFYPVDTYAVQGGAADFGTAPFVYTLQSLPLFEGMNKVTLIVKDSSGLETYGEWRIGYKTALLENEIPDMLGVDPKDSTQVSEFFERVQVTTPSATNIDLLTSSDDGMAFVGTPEKLCTFKFNDEGTPPFYKFSMDGVVYSEAREISSPLTVSLQSDGVYLIRIKSVNSNLVEGDVKNFRVMRDSKAPSGTISLGVPGQSVSRAGTDQVKLIVEATDNLTASAQLSYSVNGSGWETLGDGVIYADVDPGINTYTVHIRDELGNMTSFKLDKSIWGID